MDQLEVQSRRGASCRARRWSKHSLSGEPGSPAFHDPTWCSRVGLVVASSIRPASEARAIQTECCSAMAPGQPIGCRFTSGLPEACHRGRSRRAPSNDREKNSAMRTRRAFSALRGIVASLPTLSAQRARRSQSANAEFIGQRRNHWPTSKSLANAGGQTSRSDLAKNRRSNRRNSEGGQQPVIGRFPRSSSMRRIKCALITQPFGIAKLVEAAPRRGAAVEQTFRSAEPERPMFHGSTW